MARRNTGKEQKPTWEKCLQEGGTKGMELTTCPVRISTSPHPQTAKNRGRTTPVLVQHPAPAGFKCSHAPAKNSSKSTTKFCFHRLWKDTELLIQQYQTKAEPPREVTHRNKWMLGGQDTEMSQDSPHLFSIQLNTFNSPKPVHSNLHWYP